MELKELQERFRSDRFAAAMGAEILEARPGYAKCGLVLGELHRNAAGGGMGGMLWLFSRPRHPGSRQRTVASSTASRFLSISASGGTGTRARISRPPR